MPLWRLLVLPRATVLLRCITGRPGLSIRSGSLCVRRPQLNSSRLHRFAGCVRDVGNAILLAIGGPATTKRHVTFESWCQRDHLIVFDFDPNIVSIAGQPSGFEFAMTDGCCRSHMPDYFLRAPMASESLWISSRTS